ncbi:uncharacterized protein LOC143289493 [Babylonia areolata]|uniref:uncharacterized protein LOC143289493 n=1 Tax=Babylonia areolata TaxID=304850 RepID=UPI003FD33E5E
MGKTWSWCWWCQWWSALQVVVVVMLCMSPVSGARKDAEEGSGSSAPVLKCWECSNYDLTGKFYDFCPMNDTVDPSRAYLGNCTGKCFTHTDDLNDKKIYRGCSTTQWNLPKPLPPDGCYPWYSEIWCVCSTDACNGVKLGRPTSDVEFDAHIDYSKPPGRSGHVSLTGDAITTALLCLLSPALVVISSLH